MRILILSSEFPPGPGGIGTHAYQLARYFAQQDQLVLVLTPQDYMNEAEVSAFNSNQAFSIMTLAGSKNPAEKAISRSRMLKKAIGEFKPDVVLVSGGRSIWLSALVLRGKKIPWLVVGHGTEFGTKLGIASIITRIACNQANAVVCVSDYTRARMTSLGVKRPQIAVIHNGADAQFFHLLPSVETDDFRKANGVEGKFVLLTVGNVSARKGQELVIRALPAVIQEHPNLVYWMAGLPSQRPELEALAVQLGVAAHILFWGRVNQETLLRLYNACDLFVMTSQQLKNGDFEGYGIAVIEAALCGKASVVSDNSGLSEAVRDGETGLHVPQGAVEPIANAINRLMDSPELMQRLSDTAHFQAAREHTWDQVGHAYLELFRHIQAGS